MILNSPSVLVHSFFILLFGSLGVGFEKYWQEMLEKCWYIFLLGLNPWTYPDWSHYQDEDEQNRRGEERLPPLRQEI